MKNETNHNHKISVITPVFNDESFINDTLLSILSQTYTNIEVIIVDDFSSDRTIDLIRKIDDPRIKLLCNKTNYGAAYSRNLALQNATGDYVAFLDGDDLWEKTKLEKQLDFMIKTGANFSYTPFQIIDEKGKPLGKIVSGPKKITHKKFLRSNYIGCLTVMFKRSVSPNLCIPNDIFKRNDYALWLKLSERCDCYRFDECLAFYRKRTNNSISSGKKAKMFKSHKILFQKLYNFSNVRSFFYALRNVFYFFIRRIKYTKKLKKNKTH